MLEQHVSPDQTSKRTMISGPMVHARQSLLLVIGFVTKLFVLAAFQLLIPV